jgi:hypothetical protein
MALEKQAVAEFHAIIGADIDKDAIALAAKEILEKKAVLADLGEKLHAEPL